MTQNNGQFTFESLFKRPEVILDFYKASWTEPKRFIQELELDQDPLMALLLIACAAALTTFLSPTWFFGVGSRFSLTVYSSVSGVVMTLIICGVFHLFRKTLSMGGGFSEYLCLSGYGALQSLLGISLSIISFQISYLASLLIFVWLLYAFFIRFHPNPLRVILLVFGLFLLSGIVSRSFYTFPYASLSLRSDIAKIVNFDRFSSESRVPGTSCAQNIEALEQGLRLLDPRARQNAIKSLKDSFVNRTDEDMEQFRRGSRELARNAATLDDQKGILNALEWTNGLSDCLKQYVDRL